MAISFTKDDTNNSNTISYKATSGRFQNTFVTGRGLWQADLSGNGFTTDNVISIKAFFWVLTNLGSATYELYTGTTLDNWGTKIDASAADWGSTAVNSAGTNVIGSSSQTVSWTIDKNNIDLNGIVYLVMHNNNHGQSPTTNTNITLATSNHATQSVHPHLIITTKDGVKKLLLLGVG